MTALAHDLDSDELGIANELIRSAIRLCAGREPDRMALIAAQAAGQIAGVTEVCERDPMASALVAIHARRVFGEAMTRAYLHAMPDRGLDPAVRLLCDDAATPPGDPLQRRAVLRHPVRACR